MTNSLTANELKTRGISVVEDRISPEGEVMVSVRGKDKYVIMSLEKYDQLRECELEAALREAQADYESGRVIEESVEDHIRRLNDDV